MAYQEEVVNTLTRALESANVGMHDTCTCRTCCVRVEGGAGGQGEAHSPLAHHVCMHGGDAHYRHVTPPPCSLLSHPDAPTHPPTPPHPAAAPPAILRAARHGQDVHGAGYSPAAIRVGLHMHGTSAEV